MSEPGKLAPPKGPRRAIEPARALPRSSLGDRADGFVSIGAKLSLAVVITVGSATALTFVYFTAREHDTIVDAKRQAAEMVVDLFAASLRAPLDFDDQDAVNVELDNLKQNRDVTSAVVWRAGKPEPVALHGEKSSTPPPQARPSTVVLVDRVVVRRPVASPEGKRLGATVVEFSLARENATYLTSRDRMLWLCMLVALGTMLVLLIVTRREVMQPIEALLDAIRRLARGDRGVTVQVSHKDELGRLARAFESMGAAIVDREQRLAEAHESLRELFDHMRQAILVFDRDGRVIGAQSRQAERIFERQELVRSDMRELLYPDAGPWDAELRAFAEWVDLAFESTPETWPDVAEFAPTTVRLRAPTQERVLALEFRPIFAAEQLDRIMLLCTDETEKYRLEREVVAQGERHARQMAAMRRLVSGGGQQFVVFLEATRARLARGVELDAFNECFGHVHTLRGEARLFGLDDLATWAETLEARLSERRARTLADGGERVDVSDAPLGQEFERALALVDEAERLFVEASPIGHAVLEQVTVQRPDLARLCQLAEQQGGELAQLSERVSARSLGELTAPLAESAARWAQSVNKRARVEVDGREVRIPSRLARLLGGTLTHLVKNAVAHGIESPDERARVGKPSVGVIRIGAAAASGTKLEPTIFVEDDGRGIAENPLLAGLAGRALEPTDAADGSFRTGEPNVQDELSGRGMGLAAVVRELGTVGFTLRVESLPSGGTRCSVEPRAMPKRVESGARP
jgi:HAMP domain-containing protein/HPt (histidine-containing phosphotransfer) domain-containing protein